MAHNAVHHLERINIYFLLDSRDHFVQLAAVFASELDRSVPPISISQLEISLGNVPAYESVLDRRAETFSGTGQRIILATGIMRIESFKEFSQTDIFKVKKIRK